MSKRTTTIIALAVLMVLLMGRRARAEREAAALAPRPGLPTYAARGPLRVGTRDLTIDDDHPLTATLWYPTPDGAAPPQPHTYPYRVKLFAPLGAVPVARVLGLATRDAPYDHAGGPYPLVIFSPGFALGSAGYAWLGEQLASHGFVVIAPEHVENFSGDMADFWQAASTRPQDVLALLAYVDRQTAAGGTLDGVVDPQVAAVVGHSYGGYTALAAAGARIDGSHLADHCAAAVTAGHPQAWLCDMLLPHLPEMAALAGAEQAPDGLWPAAADPRIAAVVSLAGDAFQFGPDGLAQVTAPVLAIGGTADTGTPYLWGTHPTFEHVASASKARVGLIDAEHMVFTGICRRTPVLLRPLTGEFCVDPVWERQRAHDLTNHFTTAFLLAELKQDAAARAALAPATVTFPDVTYDARGY